MRWAQAFVTGNPKKRNAKRRVTKPMPSLFCMLLPSYRTVAPARCVRPSPLVEKLFPGGKEVPDHHAHQQDSGGEVENHVPVTGKLDDETRDRWGQDAGDRGCRVGQTDQHASVFRSNI